MGLRMLRRWRTFWKHWLACFGSWDISWYSSRRSEGILGRGTLLFFSRCKLLRHAEAWGMRRIQLFTPVQLAGTADRQTTSVTLTLLCIDYAQTAYQQLQLCSFGLYCTSFILVYSHCMYVCVCLCSHQPPHPSSGASSSCNSKKMNKRNMYKTANMSQICPIPQLLQHI